MLPGTSFKVIRVLFFKSLFEWMGMYRWNPYTIAIPWQARPLIYACTAAFDSIRPL